MSTNPQEETAEVFMRPFGLPHAGVIALIAVPFIAYVAYHDQRIYVFETTLRHSSPDELEVEDSARSDLYHLPVSATEGQTVYVPAYSHVYHRDGDPYLLTITLSVRNTSRDSEIILSSVRYYDTNGKEARSFFRERVRLPALGTIEVVIEREDVSGGSGANFLVEWYATGPVTEPIIEAVMIDTSSQQGISFVRRGSAISEVVSHPSETKVNLPQPTNVEDSLAN